MAKGLVWFRTDLRLDDNPALNAALNACDEVYAIYIFSYFQWDAHSESNIKQEFLVNNLILLKESLKEIVSNPNIVNATKSACRNLGLLLD